MTVPEMFAKIEENQEKIKSMFDPSTFTLMKEAHELMNENERLMKACADAGQPYKKDGADE